MPIDFDELMLQRLKQAEMAERELARLQPPRLRGAGVENETGTGRQVRG